VPYGSRRVVESSIGWIRHSTTEPFTNGLTSRGGPTLKNLARYWRQSTTVVEYRYEYISCEEGRIGCWPKSGSIPGRSGN